MPRPKLMDDDEIQRSVRKPKRITKAQRAEAVKPIKKELTKTSFKLMDAQKALKKAQKSRDKVKATKKVVVRNAVIRTIKRKNRAINYAYTQVRKFANEKVALKLKRYTLAHNDCLSSVSSFPIIAQWCKNSGVNFTTFSIFILLNHYEWFTAGDGVFFGYNKALTNVHLKKLVALDLAHYKRSTVTLFVASPLGKQTFVDFKKYHDERLKELMDEFEKSVNPHQNPFNFRKNVIRKKRNANQEDQNEPERS